MEPRNNVSITFDISRGAADKLKQLIDKDENVLKNLGILTVHFNNGPLAKVSQPASSVTQKTTTDNSPVAGTSSSNECTASSSASNVAQLDELLQTAQKVSVSNLSATQSANGEFDLNSSRRLLAQFLGQSPLKREITGTSANVNGPPFKLNAIAAQKTEVSSLLSTASSVRSSQTPSTDSIPIVQLTSTSNVTQSPCTTQSSPLPVGKINSLSFANVQYTVHPKPMQPGTYTLSTGNTIVATSACPTVQSALGGVPAAMTTSNSAPSTSIQSSHVNHPNHHPHIVSLQNNKFHIHPLTSSQITPSSSSSAITSPSSATNTQQITLNCQRFATPQQVLHQQLNRSPTIQMAPIGHNSLNHKSPPRVSTPNHTVFAVGSPSIKAPYIRNPNVGSNIRIGLQSLPPELMSKDTRQLNLPSNTIVTVTAGSTCNSISFPTSASGSNLNSINLPTSTRLGNESPGSTTSSNNSSSSTSNVALTSPLLVNLLQSEVSCDTSSMNSNHGCNSSIVTVPISSSAMLHSAFGSSNTVANVTVNHSMVMQPPPTASGLKEPIVKKAKIKKSRKPKDKPPDYEMKPATNNGSAVSSVTTFVTSASTTGRKISPSELYQSQLLQTSGDSLSQLVQNTNLVITSSSSISQSNDSDKSKNEIKSEPNISILPINKDVQLTDYNNSNLRLISSSNGIAVTTNNNNIAHHHQAVTNFSPLTNQSNADNVQTLPSNDCNNPNNNHSLVTTAQGTSSSHSSIKKDQHPQSDHLIGKCSKLPQKKSDSFLNLPSPVEENKTKHLINPFTGHMEPMMSEDDEEEAAHHNVTLPARTSHMIPTGKLVECKDHPSDTDSGIGKLTNDGSSQSSSEISPVEIGHTLTVNDLITKSNDIGSCAQVDISKGALVSSTQTMAFIPTLLDQEPSVQSLNARVPTLTCDLVSESGDSLLADDRIVNVNDMLTGSIGKDLMSDQNTNTSSVVETSFVDGLLNPAPIEKHGPAVTAMSSGLGLVEGEICTLISDSACSESFEMIVDEPSKVLNDIFHHESQTNMISTLTSNLNDVQHTDVAVDGDSMLVDGPELEEMQVTVQCVEDHEPVADESSSSSAPCLINNNCNLLAEPSSNDLNVNGDDLDSKIDRSSATSLPIGVQLDHEMDGTESIEIRAEGNEMLDNLGSSQLHSVASGDHNYTSLKRNCALGYSKIGTNAKNVNI